MKIFPKTSEHFDGLNELIPYVEKYKGIELQYFDKDGLMNYIDIKTPVEKLLEKAPYIEEITIHPPLLYYDIENILFKDENIIINQLKTLVELSQKHNIKFNLLYHTHWDFKKHKELTINKIKSLLDIINGEKVTLLLENLYMFDEDECTVFKIAEYINHPNLKVCFDICHMYCKANIAKTNIEKYIAKYLNKELCRKYIYQVHFSYTVGNDGYVEKRTHGRVHPSKEDLIYDLKLLKEYNMFDCNYITEISEEDYFLRPDQLKELKMLEETVTF